MENSQKTNATSSIYQPLDTSKREIRFIRIHHGNYLSISFELGICSLNDAPTYTALSYCWTDQPPTCQIFVNGAPFWVRPNLYAYLELIRDEDDSSWIFIDAICINQEDIAERNYQVGLMGATYRGAQEVVAWLGVEDSAYHEYTEKSMSEMEHICNSEDELSALVDDSSRRRVRLAFLLAFLPWNYWSRVWVVQEVILARFLTLRYKKLRLKPEIILSLTQARFDENDETCAFNIVQADYARLARWMRMVRTMMGRNASQS